VVSLWIVVSKQIQAKGIGGERCASRGGRPRERPADDGRKTSGLPSYELTRKFYLKHNYEVAAILKDYYADAHDMVVYRKRL